MADVKDDGGSAFPVPMVYDGVHVENVNERGLSVRDYFAAHAPVGDLFMSAVVTAMARATQEQDQDATEVAAKVVAAWAYIYADALLAERAKSSCA